MIEKADEAEAAHTQVKESMEKAKGLTIEHNKAHESFVEAKAKADEYHRRFRAELTRTEELNEPEEEE